ncbi:efflux RND transporter periplasmic adaptor subunit [Spongiibacter sp. KMU-158]|uniref:Efflux RND transporter periplasmic adaptor subunit n=1 Tax=Spongiibacter pelagi TaxID=2760804 RepID=A0A927C1W9_9GAMM|nr:efflux RND transporter periplasmic adaptor subunit [Spongiibacter pelagi]MBD2859768.1 efflux RND transporter periplasmic adaptor subunit [Spongiibacter pelagi]
MAKIPKQAMSAGLIVLGAIIVAAIMIALRQPPEMQELPKQQLLVDVAYVEKETLSIPVYSQGNVTPITETTLVSEVNGKVIEVAPLFEAGGLVEKGDLLLSIDDRIYQAEVKRAQAAVATARNALSQEVARARVARDDLKKYPRKYSSQADLDRALRKPQVEDARARLDSARADLEQAKVNLDRTHIRAPYRGLVKARMVDLGQYVGTGSQLGQMFSVDRAEVRLPIPADRIPYLDLPDSRHPEYQPEVVLENELGQLWKGKIVRTEGVLDARSRVLFIVAQINDPYRLNSQGEPLLAGSFVKAKISGREMTDLIALPRNLLRAGGQVWVLDEELKLRNRQVKTLKTEGDFMLVSEGLQEGERVCLSPIPNAVVGTQVEINTSQVSSDLHRQSIQSQGGEQTQDKLTQGALTVGRNGAVQ